MVYEMLTSYFPFQNSNVMRENTKIFRNIAIKNLHKNEAQSSSIIVMFCEKSERESKSFTKSQGIICQERNELK